jgi:DNA-directed RNA polymerase
MSIDYNEPIRGIHQLDELIHDIEAELLEPEHEASMREMALTRFEKRNAKAIAAGRGSTVEPLKGTIPALLEATTRLLEQRAAGETNGKRRSQAIVAIRESGVAYDVAALIGIRTVLDSVSMGAKLTMAATSIGGRIEDEARLIQLKKREPLLFKRMEQDLKDRGSQDLEFRRKALKRAIDKAYSEEEWLAWTSKQKFMVGLEVADALSQHGLIYKSKVTRRKGKGWDTESFLLLTPEAEQALAERSELVKAALKPWFKPMLHVPRPWSKDLDGGYTACDLSLIKAHSREHRETIRQADMPAVYDALNAIQATPWKVNDDVWFVARELFAADQGEAGLPRQTTPPAPVRPSDIPPVGEDLDDRQKAMLADWKGETRDWHNNEGKRRSKATQARQMLTVAEEMRQYRRFYFPHQLDYRGRIYPVPLQLNPQGDDLAKGMLAFAEGKPLGVMGAFWLAVHGANTWANDGIDKTAMERRVDWVVEHEEDILRCASDPLEHRWWTEADGGGSPFQFLAFCLEWAAYVESGESPEFMSHLPVGMDGSCNGLQHFSAMLKDPIGAEATNLVPTDKPNDIYAQVAGVVRAKLADRLKLCPSAERELVGKWIEHGVNRDLVKQPVMTTPYGVTRSGMREQLESKLKKRPSATFSSETPARERWEAINYLTPIVDEAICEVVSASRQAMDFLRGVSTSCMKTDRDPMWVAPSGFPVWQRLFMDSTRRVRSKLLGNTAVLLRVQTKRRDVRAHSAALPPNFVHSLDAAHLALTVAAMEKEGTYSWAMVHDSFGTHAGDIDAMAEVLRHQFVMMYENTDLLHELVEGMRFPEGAEIPVLPAEGAFDLSQVYDAEFFFA